MNRWFTLITDKKTNATAILDIYSTKEKAIKECEEWGWNYDDGTKSYWMGFVTRLNDYRSLKVNDRVFWLPDEPHAKLVECVVTATEYGHAIAKADNLTLWIDNDTINQFLSIERT